MKKASDTEGMVSSGGCAHLEAPRELEAHTFNVAHQQYALLEWEVQPARAMPPLTSAQRNVLELALQGLSNEEIARARGTHPRTIANQMAAIFTRLGVSSRLELFALFA